MSLKIEWFKTVLIPAQHILKKLDPENQRSVEEVISDLQPLQDQYVNLGVRNRPDLLPGINIKEALKIYKSFTSSKMPVHGATFRSVHLP